MQWHIPTAVDGESALGAIFENLEMLNARVAERHVVHTFMQKWQKSTRVGQMQAHKYTCQSTRVAERHIEHAYAKVAEWDNWHICRCLWRMQQEAADQRAKYTHSKI